MTSGKIVTCVRDKPGGKLALKTPSRSEKGRGFASSFLYPPMLAAIMGMAATATEQGMGQVLRPMPFALASPGEEAETPLINQLKRLNDDFSTAGQLSKAGQVAAGARKRLDTLEAVRDMIENSDLNDIKEPMDPTGPLSRLIDSVLFLFQDSTGPLQMAAGKAFCAIIQEIGFEKAFPLSFGGVPVRLHQFINLASPGKPKDVRTLVIQTLLYIDNPNGMRGLRKIFLQYCWNDPHDSLEAGERIAGMLEITIAMREAGKVWNAPTPAAMLIPLLNEPKEPPETRMAMYIAAVTAPLIDTLGLAEFLGIYVTPKDAAGMLEAIGRPEAELAIPALAQALRSSHNPKDQEALARALKKIGAGDPLAVRALEDYKTRPLKIKVLTVSVFGGLLILGLIIGRLWWRIFHGRGQTEGDRQIINPAG